MGIIYWRGVREQRAKVSCRRTRTGEVARARRNLTEEMLRIGREDAEGIYGIFRRRRLFVVTRVRMEKKLYI